MTPSREAEKDYQGYFNSPPHKKNHIATTMINTVFFKISTHILTKRMTENVLYISFHGVISTHILTKRMTFFMESLFLPICNFNSHPHEEDDQRNGKTSCWKWNFNSHPHEEDDEHQLYELLSLRPFQLTSSRRG